MASHDEKNVDFYAVLGLNKDCTSSDLKTAYRKLALRWHPDRCSPSVNSKHVEVEEAKRKFQTIQHAYSVLSDVNKRFLYDVGAYDDDDDENMGDFLDEMIALMSQNKPDENEVESLEELQELFNQLFQSDTEDAFPSTHGIANSSMPSSLFASSGAHKQNSADTVYAARGKVGESSGLSIHSSRFRPGTDRGSGQFQEKRKSNKKDDSGKDTCRSLR